MKFRPRALNEKSVPKLGKFERAFDIRTYLQQGLRFHQSGRFQEARSCYQTILAVDSKHFDALQFCAVLEAQLGRPELALKLFDQALAVQRSNAVVLNNRGNTLRELKRLDEALASYDEAIRTQSDYADAFYNRGIALKELKRLDEALASYNEAIRIRPNYAEALSNRGIILKELKRLDEALASYDEAIRIRPNYAEALSNRGNTLRELKRLDEALASYREARKIKLDYAEAFYYEGNTLHQLKRFDEALASYDEAIRIKPNYADAFFNRGVTLHELRYLDEALTSYEEAIRIKPDYAEAYTNRGVALGELKHLDDALASYEQAVRIKPDYADAYWNQSLALLLLGRFVEGWALYEWRMFIGDQKETYDPGQGLAWRGEEIFGRRLLIHSEQGLGDSIQFVRYLPKVQALGAKVFFLVEKPLLSLFASMKLPITLVGKGDPLPDFDAYCPLLSLPYVFKTTLDTIPAEGPYLFADEGKVAQFRNRSGLHHGFRVGLVWSGSSTHKNDANRSIPPELLLPLLDIPVLWHSLQKEYRATDLAVLEKASSMQRHDHELNDFSDTAALIAHMDIVICVDTSVAHLAGAMGKEVWVLLPFVPDFRWLMGRDDTPWYPSMKLYRQPSPRDWDSVLKRVRSDLATRFGTIVIPMAT